MHVAVPGVATARLLPQEQGSSGAATIAVTTDRAPRRTAGELPVNVTQFRSCCCWL
jgi:hypothetical protein